MKITTAINSKVPGGNPFYQYLAAATGMLSIVTSGMHYGWPSPSLPKMENSTSFQITADEGSWMAVMPLLGSVLGSIIAASTADILGRKRMILISSFPFFTAWILVAFSKSVILLYIARFMAGITDGWVFTAVPMYMGEIAEPHIRGLLGSGVSTCWIFGILLINIVGAYLSITTAALISSVVPILSFFGFLFMPESPYFLLMRSQEADAKKSLQKFRGKEDVENELDRISKAVRAQMESTGRFWDLFVTKSNRRAVLIMMILRGTQQLSGTTAITFYTQKIFQEAGDDISSELATIIYFAIQFGLTVLCSSIVDRAGRRPLLIISLVGSAVALFIEGGYFFLKNNTSVDVSSLSILPVVSLIGFVIMFGLGMQSIPILMLGELFPANVKAFALCFADMYFSFVATIVSKFFQIMKDSFGIYLPFFAFTGCCFLGLIFIVLYVPETKGKTLEEIQQWLGGKTGVESNTTESAEKDKKIEVI